MIPTCIHEVLAKLSEGRRLAEVTAGQDAIPAVHPAIVTDRPAVHRI
jgi:hypothetical protein